MAIYEYRCHACGHKEEKKVPMSDSKIPRQCPECGAKLTKIISLVNHRAVI